MTYQVGERVDGVINNITDLGLFLTLPGHFHGLVHKNDFDGDWTRNRNRYHVGDKLRVVVIHHHQKKLALSLKRVKDPSLIDPKNQFSHLKAADFAKVLNQTAQDAKDEITKLKEVLLVNK